MRGEQLILHIAEKAKELGTVAHSAHAIGKSNNSKSTIIDEMGKLAGKFAGSAMGHVAAKAMGFTPWGRFFFSFTSGLLGSEAISYILDESVSFEQKVEYANALTEKAHQFISDFTEFAGQFAIFQSASVLLTDNQRQSLEQFSAKMTPIIADIEAIKKQGKPDQASLIQLTENLHKKMQEASQLIQDAKKEMGLVRVNQDKLESLMQGVSDTQSTSHYAFTKTIEDTSQTIFGAAKLLYLFGDKEIANDLATVGLSTLSAIEQGSALMGYGLLAGSVNPVFAVAAIAEAITNIVGLFSKQKYQENPNKVILNAIRKLFDVVEDLQKNMQVRFDEIQAKLDHQSWLFLEKFIALKTTQTDTVVVLNTIYQEMHAGFANQEQRLSGIAQQLFALHQQVGSSPYRADLDFFKETLRFVMQNTVFDEFNPLSASIDHRALENGIHHQAKSVMDLSEDASASAFFETTTYLSHELNTSFAHNPLFLLYGSIANLLLILKKYPIPNAELERHRLSKRDFDRLMVYQKNLQDFEAIIFRARTPNFLQLKKLQTMMLQLADAIEVETDRFEKQLTKQKRMSNEALLTSKNAAHWNSFQEDSPIETEKWFTGTHTYERVYHTGTGRRRWGGKAGQWHHDSTTDAYTDIQKREAYIQQQLKNQREQKSQFRIMREQHQEMMRDNPDQLHLFKPAHVNAFHEGLFFVPTQPGLPYLSVPDPLFQTNTASHAVMLTLKEAQNVGLGLIRFSYALLADKNQIEYRVAFESDHQPTKQMMTIVLPYTKRPHGLMESVWNDYMGGTIYTDFEGDTQSIRKQSDSAGTYKNGEYDAHSYAVSYPKTPIHQVGKKELFDQPDSLLINEADLLKLKQMMHDAYSDFRTEYRRKLHAQMDLSQTNELSKIAYEFATIEKIIRGLLTIAYFDDMQNARSELRQLSDRYTVTLHRLHALPLETNISATVRQIALSISDFQHQLHMLQQSSLNFQLLEDVKAIFNETLELYKPYVVTNNDAFPIANQDERVNQLQTKIIVRLVRHMLSAQPTDVSQIQSVIQDELKNEPTVIAEEVALRVMKEFHAQENALPSSVQQNVLQKVEPHMSNPIKNKITVVFDIDGVLVDENNNIRDVTTRSFIEKTGAIIHAVGSEYYVYPGVLPLMQFLITNPLIDIAFFSAGVKERNTELVEKLLILAIGQDKYQQIKNNIIVLSRNDLVPNNREDAEKMRWSHGLRWGNMKKDIRKALQNGLLENAVIIEDDSSYIHYGQEGNLLYSESINIDWYLSHNDGINPINKKMFFVAGVLSYCIDEIKKNNKKMIDVLSQLQYKRSTETSGYELNYDLIREERFYQMGVQCLQTGVVDALVENSQLMSLLPTQHDANIHDVSFPILNNGNRQSVYGLWDQHIEIHPETHEPLFTFRLYNHSKVEIGSVQFYGHPLFCRSELGDRHNIVKTTGIFSKLLINATATQEICEALPPTFSENMFYSAAQGAKYGALRGISAVTGETLKHFKQPKSVITLAQFGVYWTGLVLILFFENINSSKQDRDFPAVMMQSIISATFFMVIDLCLQCVAHGLKNVGEKATKNGWNKTGETLVKLSSALPLCIYAWKTRHMKNDEYMQYTAATAVGVAAGCASQLVIEGSGKKLVDVVYPTRHMT